jgi:dTDP-4-dehydrorhamnose 3,5-epimerase
MRKAMNNIATSVEPRFNFINTKFEGLYVVERSPISDSRGYFERAFCHEEFSNYGDSSTVQINRSFTIDPGVIRGMHFQKSPYAEQKIVTCLAGKIFDVVIDTREESLTYRQWFGIELSAERPLSVLIPAGFAHGFQTLSENCLVEYFVNAPFTPNAENGINAMDPKIAISWPLPCSGMSDKDRKIPFLEN